MNRHGDNGWLVDFFDNQALIERIMQALSTPAQSIELRKNSQVSAKKYAVANGIKEYKKEILQFVRWLAN